MWHLVKIIFSDQGENSVNNRPGQTFCSAEPQNPAFKKAREVAPALPYPEVKAIMKMPGAAVVLIVRHPFTRWPTEMAILEMWNPKTRCLVCFANLSSSSDSPVYAVFCFQAGLGFQRQAGKTNSRQRLSWEVVLRERLRHAIIFTLSKVREENGARF